MTPPKQTSNRRRRTAEEVGYDHPAETRPAAVMTPTSEAVEAILVALIGLALYARRCRRYR
jgi:hypothetical protein